MKAQTRLQLQRAIFLAMTTTAICIVQDARPNFMEGTANKMKTYTLAQILEAWAAAYGEDMNEEYPGFIQRLSEETDKKTDIKNLKEQIKNEEN